MVGGVAVVGYILWKRGVFGSKKSDSKFSGFTADNNFFNATGTRLAGRTRTGVSGCSAGNPYECNICGQSCENGICYVAIYGTQGEKTYVQKTCREYAQG